VRGKERLQGLAATGYCAALKTYFHGVREHLIFTPEGRLAFLLELPGNRHDVHGAYALLKTGFQGRLVGDCAYQPRSSMDQKLHAQGVHVWAAQKSNARTPRPEAVRKWLHRNRAPVERRIGLFDQQFCAERTRNRSLRHYLARRWTKALAHNASRHISQNCGFNPESLAHFHAIA
jgi:hypothetical protein